MVAAISKLGCACQHAGSVRVVDFARAPHVVRSVRACGVQSVVKSDARSESLEQLKVKIGGREAWSLRGQEVTMSSLERLSCIVASVASQALRDKAVILFARICVNPKILTSEAAEFMLSVASSHPILSPLEAEAASQADLILRGLHPRSFQPVVLVCTTTMFAEPVAHADVERAKSRGDLWQRAVGPAFRVVPVVAGFAVPHEVATFSSDLGVECCDISR